jgi:hypothetical protein
MKRQKFLPENISAIGWREWVSLPELGIERIKAKIDTGARTSALHAFNVRPYKKLNRHRIHFEIHPLQHNDQYIIECDTEVIDMRIVSDSGGHKEKRYVIKTPILLGDKEFPIEITLTNRDNMLFRMLLGRTAIRKGKFFINPATSFLL